MTPYYNYYAFIYSLETAQTMKLLLFSHQVLSNSETPWTAACQASLSLTISRSLPKFMSIEPVMPSNHLTLCRPLLLLPSIFPGISTYSVGCTNKSCFDQRDSQGLDTGQFSCLIKLEETYLLEGIVILVPFMKAWSA